MHKHYHKKNQTKLIDDLLKHHHKKKQSELLVDLHRYHHKQKLKNIKEEIYRSIQKRKTNQIIDKLKRLKRLKRSNLAKKENISQNELDKIKRLSDFYYNSKKKTSSPSKYWDYRLRKICPHIYFNAITKAS